MNKYALYHKSESEYCFPISEKRALIRFRTAKNDEDIKQINLLYNMSAYFPHKRFKKKMELVRNDELFSYYEAEIECEIPSYFYAFEIVNNNNEKSYFLENGLNDKMLPCYIGMLAFRIPFINKVDTLLENKKLQGDVVYEIFPERFFMADEKKDKSYINREWSSKELKGHFLSHDAFLGGDLQGICAKLDYIKDLGVDTIYLTPITKSSSNHKYNIEDYYTVDPMFGTNDDFKNLVRKAHVKGLKIIMDLVFNHTAVTHPFFQDVLKNGKSSIYYDFYCMQEAPLKVDKLNYYSFNSCKYMPKINTNNKIAQDYLIDVAKFYINEFDVDGFRLDVANEVSHVFWIKFNLALREIKPDLYIVGENWDNAHEYLKNYEFDGIMNYTFYTICNEFFLSNNMSTTRFVDQLNWLLTRYPNEANKMSFNLLDSHDTPRLFNYMKGNKDKYLLAVLVMVSYIGMPMLYYGDEIFMMGGPDPENRAGMNWDSKEFQSHYHVLFKDIIKLRKLELFRNGNIRICDENGLVKISRFDKKHQINVIINPSRKYIPYQIDGNIILSNRYQDNILKSYSFVVVKTK